MIVNRRHNVTGHMTSLIFPDCARGLFFSTTFPIFLNLMFSQEGNVRKKKIIHIYKYTLHSAIIPCPYLDCL